MKRKSKIIIPITLIVIIIISILINFKLTKKFKTVANSANIKKLYGTELSEGETITIDNFDITEGDNSTNSVNTVNGNNLNETELMTKIQQLGNLANEFAQTYNEGKSNVEQVPGIEFTLQYIRRNRYNSGAWKKLAGEIDSDFVNYVAENNSSLSEYNFNNVIIIDPITGEEIDFTHMCASLNSYIYWPRLISWPCEFCRMGRRFNNING